MIQCQLLDERTLMSSLEPHGSLWRLLKTHSFFCQAVKEEGQGASVSGTETGARNIDKKRLMTLLLL